MITGSTLLRGVKTPASLVQSFNCSMESCTDNFTCFFFWVSNCLYGCKSVSSDSEFKKESDFQCDILSELLSSNFEFPD